MTENSKQDLEYAWAAGFIDGEGHFLIGKSENGYFLQLRVTGCHQGSLQRLSRVFGVGTIYVHHRETIKNNASFVWVVAGQKAICTIKLILPYLCVKTDEAMVALEYEALLRTKGEPILFCLIAKRHRLFLKMRDLKARNRFSV